jgi:hypothetical protein
MSLLRVFIMSMMLSSVVFFISCGNYYYYPTQQNVLKFKEKKDLSVNAGSDVNGFTGYTLGYAVSDHVGVITDFNSFGTKKTGKFFDGYNLGAEAVFFHKMKEHFYPAINVGVGFGQINRNTDDYNVNFNRQFIQPSFGFSNRFFDIAVSSRFSRVNHDLNILNPSADLINYQLGDIGQRSFYFFEPAITFGVGYKFVKLRMQTVDVTKLSAGDISYVNRNTVFSLNFNFNLNKVFKREEE